MARKILLGFLGFGLVFTALLLWRVNNLVRSRERDQTFQKAQLALDLLSQSLQAKTREIRQAGEAALRGAPENPSVLLASTFDSASRALDRASIRESGEVKGWGASYVELALQNAAEAKENGGAALGTEVLTLLSPAKKPYLLFVYGGAKPFVVLSSASQFQVYFDQLSTSGLTVYAFNSKGIALAHTGPQYIGYQMRESPLVKATLAGDPTESTKFHFSNRVALADLHLFLAAEKEFEQVPAPTDIVNLFILAVGLLAVGGGMLLMLQKQSEPEAKAILNPSVVPIGASASVRSSLGDSGIHIILQKLLARFRELFLQTYRAAQTEQGPNQIDRKSLDLAYEEFDRLLILTQQKQEGLKMASLAELLTTDFRGRERQLHARGIQVQKDWQNISAFPFHEGRARAVISLIWDFLAEKFARTISKKIEWSIEEDPASASIIWKVSGSRVELTDLDKQFLSYLSSEIIWSHGATNDAFILMFRVPKGAEKDIDLHAAAAFTVSEFGRPLVESAGLRAAPATKTSEQIFEAPAASSPGDISQSVIHELRMSNALRAMNEEMLEDDDDANDVAPPFAEQPPPTSKMTVSRMTESNPEIDVIVSQTLSTARAEKLFARKTRVRRPGEGAQP